jgi:hypothetical protein
MTALLIKYAPYILGALALFGAGIWTGHELDKPAYAKLQGQYEAFQVQVANVQAASQKAATDALEAQIAARNATEEHNAQIIRTLQSRADTAESDRDFARRLLAAATQSRPATGGDPGPKTQGGQRPDDPPAASSDRPLTDLLGAAAGECRDAIQRFSALQAELAPQL